MARLLVCSLTLLLAASLAFSQAISGVRPVGPAADATLDFSVKAGAQGLPEALWTLDKTEDYRQLAAIEMPVAQLSPSIKAFEVRASAKIDEGMEARAVCILFDGAGRAWKKLVKDPLPAAGLVTVRFTLSFFAPAGFKPEAGELRIEKVTKVWVGIALDGVGKAELRLAEPHFTSEVRVPDQPLALKVTDASLWGVGADAAVKQTLTIVDEGPGATPCMRFDFDVPGGSHMYAIPSVGLPELEWEGYGALRLTWKGNTPPGMTTLLMLMESDGSQYMAEPAPTIPTDWQTLTVPFADFKLGGWTQDENGQLDLTQVNRIATGMHGTPAVADRFQATLWVSAIELLPLQ